MRTEQPGPGALPLLGELDQPRPPVAGVGPAGYVAALLEPVDDAGDVGVVAVHRGREVPHRAGLGEEAHHDRLRRAQVELGRDRGKARLPFHEHDPGEERPGLARRPLREPGDVEGGVEIRSP
jgi:hypothetical protein